MIVGDLYLRNARLWPNRTAYAGKGRRLTNAEFAFRICKLANALADIGHQERVAILANNRVEYLEVQGAAESAGFISVGLNTRLAEPEMLRILFDCAPRVLFFEDSYAELARRLMEQYSGLERLVAFDAPPAWAESYEALLASGSEATSTARATPSDIAHLIYTSGTTGQPKGVMLGHSALFEGARMTAHEGGAIPTDRILLVMPLFHIGAKIEQLAFSLAGATISIHERFDAAAVLREIEGEGVTALHLAPVLIQRLMDDPRIVECDTSSVRCMHYSASPMPSALLRRTIAKFGPVLVQIYGMSECPVGTVLKPHQHVVDGDESDVARLRSTGQEFLGTDIRVVDGNGSDCAPDAVGEILISSPANASGYWRAPDASREALQDGWLHTGDMGYLDAERFLYLVDRKKDMIVSGGENVYSQEVENVLRRHSEVADAAVIGVPDDKWGETVLAFIVPRAHGSRYEDSINEHCRAHLAGYKCPRIIEFVEEIPRHRVTGKIDKKALRAPYWKDRSRSIN